MLYVGLDLSRKRLDYHLLNQAGETVEGRRRSARCRWAPYARRAAR
jgi:hypothetical protein